MGGGPRLGGPRQAASKIGRGGGLGRQPPPNLHAAREARKDRLISPTPCNPCRAIYVDLGAELNRARCILFFAKRGSGLCYLPSNAPPAGPLDDRRQSLKEVTISLSASPATHRISHNAEKKRCLTD